MNLSDYVKVYDDTLDAVTCEVLIDLFEANPNYQRRSVYAIDGKGPENGKVIRAFTDLNLMESENVPTTIKHALLTRAHALRQKYVEDTGIEEHQWPGNPAFEQFRIKKYNPQDDKFLDHVDVTDKASAARFLAFFWYLNTPNGGGETEFYNLDKPLKVEPVQGRCVIFPPMWTFPHAGLPTHHAPKYIMGGYLHYR